MHLNELRNSVISETLIYTTGSVDLILIRTNAEKFYLVNFCTESLDENIHEITVELYGLMLKELDIKKNS